MLLGFSFDAACGANRQIAACKLTQQMRRQTDTDVPPPPRAIPMIQGKISQLFVEVPQRVGSPSKRYDFPVGAKIIPLHQGYDRHEQETMTVNAPPENLMDELVLWTAPGCAIAR